MTIVTRWAGRCGVLLAAVTAACGSESRNGNNAASAGSAGDSAGSTNQAGAGAGAAGAGTSGASQVESGDAGETGNLSGAGAGAGQGGSAGGGSSGRGGRGGRGGSGGSGGSAGTSGGTGGATGGDSCVGAQVLFLIQRSGALFEQPGPQTTGVPLPLEDSYYGFLRAALVGDASAAKPYRGKLPIGVSFLFATRDASLPNPGPVMCPQLAATAPSLQFGDSLAAAFTQSVAEHAALVSAKLKEEAPVPESIASAVASWSAVSGQRHLVLVTTAMPDTCTKFDGPCGIDATVKAVQDAKAAGVITHVIGLGNDLQFSAFPPGLDPMPVPNGYARYLQQLANSGRGKSPGPADVEKLQDYVCDGAMPAVLTATYSATPGDAEYYQVMTATDAQSAVAEILAGICP